MLARTEFVLVEGHVTVVLDIWSVPFSKLSPTARTVVMIIITASWGLPVLLYKGCPF